MALYLGVTNSNVSPKSGLKGFEILSVRRKYLDAIYAVTYTILKSDESYLAAFSNK